MWHLATGQWVLRGIKNHITNTNYMDCISLSPPPLARPLCCSECSAQPEL